MNEKELAQDNFIRGLIQNSELEEAPAGFAASVMERIESEGRATEYIPIISKKAWGLILSPFATCIALILILTPNSNGPAGLSDPSGISDPYGIVTIIRNVTDGYISIIKEFADYSFLLFIPVIISILLLLDRKFSERIRHGKLN